MLLLLYIYQICEFHHFLQRIFHLNSGGFQILSNVNAFEKANHYFIFLYYFFTFHKDIGNKSFFGDQKLVKINLVLSDDQNCIIWRTINNNPFNIIIRLPTYMFISYTVPNKKKTRMFWYFSTRSKLI